MTSVTEATDWIDVDVGILHETTRAVLVDFGADRGCEHHARLSCWCLFTVC